MITLLLTNSPVRDLTNPIVHNMRRFTGMLLDGDKIINEIHGGGNEIPQIVCESTISWAHEKLGGNRKIDLVCGDAADRLTVESLGLIYSQEFIPANICS